MKKYLSFFNLFLTFGLLVSVLAAYANVAQAADYIFSPTPPPRPAGVTEKYTPWPWPIDDDVDVTGYNGRMLLAPRRPGGAPGPPVAVIGALDTLTWEYHYRKGNPCYKVTSTDSADIDELRLFGAGPGVRVDVELWFFDCCKKRVGVWSWKNLAWGANNLLVSNANNVLGNLCGKVIKGFGVKVTVIAGALRINQITFNWEAGTIERDPCKRCCEGKKVMVAVLWSGAELGAFEKTLAPFEQDTGIDVVVESVGRDLPAVLVTRLAAGNPPDVAVMPNPGQMKEFAEQGALIPLNDLQNLADHPRAFLDLGAIDGNIYGVFISADLKSLVWYSPKAFAAKGYEVPISWPALIALCNKIVADGGTPWALGMESGAASGWVGTDWVEDIMLRTAGADLYDKWVNHEISWTHPAVKKAFEYFGQIVKAPGYMYGGATGALTIFFGDSPNALFTDPPGAYMHRQATFIQSFIKDANPDLVASEDYDVFTFPPISPEFGNPLLGAGDVISAFNDRPEVRVLLNYLASAEAQEIWCGELGKLAINKNVDPSIYPDPITAKAAMMVAEAETFRFDGSDLMPAAVGAGTFWTGVLDYVSGVPLDTVLKAIEASAIEAYGG